MVQPQRLLPGDKVAVVAPSGPFDHQRFAMGLEKVRELDLQPVYDERIFERRGYLAGEDVGRQEIFEGAIADPSCKAIWAARGGYGAMRLLDRLPLDRLVQAKKLMIGFSDITALHLALGALSLCTLHAPVVTQLVDQAAPTLSRLREILFSVQPASPLQADPVATMAPGKARGRLLGGNLTLLGSLVGTPYFPDLAGVLLLIEDVGERPYRLDRIWTQLRLAGAFVGLRGVVVGQLLRCEGDEGDPVPLALLRELIAPLGIPAAGGFPVGHCNPNEAVPLGVEAELDAGAGKLTFLQSLLA
jgi:muramoyltetrapeptide carboxypeptidase